MKQISELARWTLSLLMFLTIGFVTSLSAACTKDEVVLNAYKSLETSKVTYYAIMDSAKAMNKSGTLPDDKFSELKSYALIYVDSYLVAVSALSTYAGLMEADKGSGAELNKDQQRALLEEKVNIVTNGLNEFVKKAIQLGIDIRSELASAETVERTLAMRSGASKLIHSPIFNSPMVGN